MPPVISVGMPVFNGEPYLVEAIESILGQTFPDFELVISDNASQDGTADICSEYARQDSRIRYFRQPLNCGAPRNFNFVFEQSVGRYFKWASANDRCHPELLSACKNVLDQRPDVVLCFGKTKFIDECGTVFRDYEDNVAVDDPSPSHRFLHLVDHMEKNNVHAGLFRSEILRKTKLEQPYPSADLVLIAELSLYGKFVEIPAYLFYRREVPGAATGLRTKEEILELRSPGNKRGFYWPMWRSSLGYFAALFRSPIGMSDKARILVHLLKRYYWLRHSYWKELRANCLTACSQSVATRGK